MTTQDFDRADANNLFAALPEVDAVAQGRLHDRLAAAASDDGILDIAYRTLDSPVGSLLLAATERGLVRVAFACEDHDRILEQLAVRLSPRLLRAPARLDPVARELDEYFAGHRTQFEVPLDFQLSRGFRRTVLFHMNQIGYGQTKSYAALAAAAGNPKAARAVGSACATNPLPLIVPCHRVVRNDGTIGQYGGGTEAKKLLLAMERRT